MDLQGASSMDEGGGAASDIPSDLLPSILERVSRKGKGGRQPAADPRTVPGVDPKRAKRIIANRESAARSKLKQKVLMETLKTRQDVLVTQRMTSQEELELLRRMCRDLQAKNAQLESRIKAKDELNAQLEAEYAQLEARYYKLLESTRAQAPHPHMDVDEDLGASGSGLSLHPGPGPHMTLDEQMLAGISTLANMAHCRGQTPQHASTHLPTLTGLPQLWTPLGGLGPGDPAHAASGAALIEALHAQHMQQQQQHQQQHKHQHQQHQQQHPHQQPHQQQKVRSQSQPMLSRPQPQLPQQPRVQSPFFGNLPFGAPEGHSPLPFGSPGWPFNNIAVGPAGVGPTVIKPVPVHPSAPSISSKDIDSEGGLLGSGRTPGVVATVTPAILAQPLKRGKSPEL